MLFNSILKTVINTNIAEVYSLIYYLFILIINYYRSERGINLLEKRVCDSISVKSFFTIVTI